MAIPDNRIRFPAPRIDFNTDVGLTGQDHDDYPQPSGQARYDHLRLFLIGLLSQQSSFDEPSQFREGTPWFDLNTSTLKIRSGNAWVPLAQTISLTEPDTEGNVVSLADWYVAVQDLLAGLAPEIVFSGVCNADNITTVEVPETLRSNLAVNSRVFMYINGLLVKPISTSLIGSPPTTIRLSGLSLSNGDTFTVIIRRVPATTFYGPNVVVP
jgi:hypothetical protein